MPHPRANWDDAETKLLLDMCLQEKEKLNFTQIGVTRDGWNNLYTHFPQYDRRQVNNKLWTLRSKYLKWKKELSATGLGRDTQTGGIAAEPRYWETHYGTQPDSDDTTKCMVS